jgi:ribosomal protein S18 acetylase RimI-like enzyme
MPLIGPARPDEQAAAVRLLFGHLPPEDQLARTANVRAMLDTGELDPDGVLVARRGPALLGAMLAAPLPGGGGVVWPPRVRPGTPGADTVADALVRHAADWLRGRGTKLAQALLADDDIPYAGPLERNGFPFLTRLEYLRHFLELPPDRLAGPERLTYQTFSACDVTLFGEVLLRTYEGTRDCPEVNGVRTAAEVIAGHQGGNFDPRRWWLARLDGQPVGVLLVNSVPESGAWDVAYVGVVTAARRRGVGTELVVKALWEAKAAGVLQVSLAVDARNEPARRLYRRLGFEPFGERSAYLAVWGTRSVSPLPAGERQDYSSTPQVEGD